MVVVVEASVDAGFAVKVYVVAVAFVVEITTSLQKESHSESRKVL